MKHKSPTVFVSTFSMGLFADFASKRYAEVEFAERKLKIVGDFLVLRFQTNEGIAFSAPVTGLPLKILTIALIAYVAYFYAKEEKYR